MGTSMNFGGPISKGASEDMNSGQGLLMELHQEALPKTELTVGVFYKTANDFKRQSGLPKSVFRFARGLLRRIGYQLKCLC